METLWFFRFLSPSSLWLLMALIFNFHYDYLKKITWNISCYFSIPNRYYLEFHAKFNFFKIPTNYTMQFKWKSNMSEYLQYCLMYINIYLVFLLGRLLRTFYNKDCIRCGLFLGSLVAIFKVCIFQD